MAAGNKTRCAYACQHQPSRPETKKAPLRKIYLSSGHGQEDKHHLPHAGDLLGVLHVRATLEPSRLYRPGQNEQKQPTEATMTIQIGQ